MAFLFEFVLSYSCPVSSLSPLRQVFVHPFSHFRILTISHGDSNLEPPDSGTNEWEVFLLEVLLNSLDE